MNTYASWIVTITAVVVIIGGMIWYSYRPGDYDTFALCITEKKATFFGAWWCPHCQAQKARFGQSADKLPYVECSTVDGKGQLPLCAEEKIESYPTWKFVDGSRRSEELELSELAQLTGCPLVKDSN